ncbi:phosphotransferase enzyme family protein [Zavarzinia sp. CC-PAN008]|uniref:phosphotransferase enzyme family protein n=1 Tax=Zavarzinia sp. CC-PAN008 TaxID=3243332 RepID=UPI003F74556F
MSAESEAAVRYRPAALAALAGFGVTPAALDFVNLSENITFRAVDAADGRPLTLRLHRPGYHEIASLRSEHLWTRALAQAGIPAPEPLLTPAGDSFVEVETGFGERRWAGLARWVEGELLADVVAREGAVAVNAAHFARMGALMAAMHNQSAGWVPPPGFVRHALDADGLMGRAPFWGPFWDNRSFSAVERAMAVRLRDHLHGVLTALGKPADRYSLIHADLHPRNVLVDGTRAAVIDFDDCAFGWHLYDLAVSLASYQDHADFPTLRDACVAGYRAVRALSAQDLALLPLFLLVRELALMGWHHGRPEVGHSAAQVRTRERILEKVAALDWPG